MRGFGTALAAGLLVALTSVTHGHDLDSGINATASHIVRELTADELASPQPARLVLKLRNQEELEARVVKGDILTPAEMEARYYPTHESWRVVANWASFQGLAIAPENITHMSVQAHGSTAQVAAALQTRFARVVGRDGKEYISAVVDSSLPNTIAALLVGINQIHPDEEQIPPAGHLACPSINNHGYGPQVLLDQYGANGVGDGTGQIIAVYGSNAPPNATDLTTYWANIGSPHTMADVTMVNALSYPVYNDVASSNAWGRETTMDTEIVSGLCPGAQIRVYFLIDVGAAGEAVLADLPKFPQIHQFTISGGGPETVVYSGWHQAFIALAAQGVTTFACSGDGGSNPNTSNPLIYDPTAPKLPEYPASDPYVTAVGGTEKLCLIANGQLFIQQINGVYDVAWTEALSPPYTVPSDGTAYSLGGGSGGGISTLFQRPSWQTGPGLPAGTMRCVPDVAAEACGDFYAYIGGDTGCAGTSESAPVWAALCAILNQNLASNGQQPLGLLGPKVYPLAGTGAMNYVTQGYETNELSIVFANYPVDLASLVGEVDTIGAYNVGPTYDCITGIGIPNLALIAAALEASPSGISVKVTNPLPKTAVANGSAPLTLQATATGTPTYQWYLNGIPIVGATGATEIVYPTAANQGTYTVTVTNLAGSASTGAGSLAVSTNAWLSNLSARAYSQPGANQLIAGFVTTGTSDKSVLVRGDGPALAAFGVTGFLSDPQLTLLSGSTDLATTTSWSSTLNAAFTQVGAFAFTPGSHDTALLESAAPGPYTAQVVSATNNSGVALAEVYDADSGAPSNRLVNLSARAYVGNGANILIGGFVIAGTTPLTVVIRGDGPALTAFGVAGALPNVILTLTNSAGSSIATSTYPWSNPTIATGSGATSGITVQPLTAALSSKVGAFALISGSNDSAMVATLPAGAYTAQISGASGSTGIALVEIYELR